MIYFLYYLEILAGKIIDKNKIYFNNQFKLFRIKKNILIFEYKIFEYLNRKINI